MYGKIFDSLFTGSMHGAGAHVFAVWAYALANVNQDSHVELNARHLAPIIGSSLEEIQKAIEYLCAPDTESRSTEEDGRRLLKVGSFNYFMVNHQYYHDLRTKEERRALDRDRKAEYRKRHKPVEMSGTSPGQVPNVPQKSESPSVYVSVSSRSGTREGVDDDGPTIGQVKAWAAIKGADESVAQLYLDARTASGWMVGTTRRKPCPQDFASWHSTYSQNNADRTARNGNGHHAPDIKDDWPGPPEKFVNAWLKSKDQSPRPKWQSVPPSLRYEIEQEYKTRQ